MRFDLEFNIIGQLTQEGLAVLADTFYNTDKNADNIITPGKWDDKEPSHSTSVNVGSIDTSKYKGLNLPSWLYTSGVAGTEDVSVSRMIIRNNLICPVFNSGSIYSYKHKYNWSNNHIMKFCKLNGSSYYCDIDPDTDISSLEVYTLMLEYPGYLSKKREFEYVEYDNISLASTFTRPDKQYMFTVFENKVHINLSQISYTEFNLGKGTANKNSLLALPEFPVARDVNDLPKITINKEFLKSNIRVLTSILMVKSELGTDEDVLASYSVTPIVSYKQTSRSTTGSEVWRTINLTPSAISFKDGLLCLYNILGTAGGTIKTCDGTTILMPTDLNINISKPTLEVLDSTQISATLTGIDGIPIKNADIRFELASGNADAMFLETNGYSANARTGLDGEASVNIIINSTKFGHFAQKEWVVNDHINQKYQIKLPYKVSSTDPGQVYVYFVTADDPILGKKNAESFLKYKFIDQWQRLREGEVELPIEEYYSQEGKISSYQINGRKIAWVKMESKIEANNNVLQSYYVKPKSIETGKAFNAKFRELFIENTNDTITTDISKLDITAMRTPYSYPVNGYPAGMLPIPNTMKVNIASIENGTIIEFDEPIPDYDQIEGYWLVTGTGGTIDLKAVFEDECNLLHVESQVMQVEIINYIKSESEFILSDIELSKFNTTLGSFSYYTVSEYINNPFGINACSYGCKWSDAILKTCKHPNESMRSYYIEADDSGLCGHTPERDLNLPMSQTCPVVARYLKDEAGNTLTDPFILDESFDDGTDITDNVNHPRPISDEFVVRDGRAIVDKTIYNSKISNSMYSAAEFWFPQAGNDIEWQWDFGFEQIAPGGAPEIIHAAGNIFSEYHYLDIAAIENTDGELNTYISVNTIMDINAVTDTQYGGSQAFKLPTNHATLIAGMKLDPDNAGQYIFSIKIKSSNGFILDLTPLLNIPNCVDGDRFYPMDLSLGNFQGNMVGDYVYYIDNFRYNKRPATWRDLKDDAIGVIDVPLVYNKDIALNTAYDSSAVSFVNPFVLHTQQ